MNTFPNRLCLRILMAAGLMALAGCTTVYVPRYADEGVYYDEGLGHSYPASSGYGHDRAWAANPVHYPYWSLDYFYFSQYYHPYSVVVGSWDPYYYPYPGWRYGPRHRRHGFGISVAIGDPWYSDPWYGYPWHGYGYAYRPVHYGFFGSAWYSHGYRYGYGDGYRHGYRYGSRYGHRHGHRNDLHPVHRSNDRLRALQRRETSASRSVLISQRTGRAGGAWYVPEREPLGRATQPYKRGDVRAQRRAELRGAPIVGRSGSAPRIERRAVTPQREASRSTTRSRIQARPTAGADRSAPRRIERHRSDPTAAVNRARTRSQSTSRRPDAAPVRSTRGSNRAVERTRHRSASRSTLRTRGAYDASRAAPAVQQRSRSNRRETLHRTAPVQRSTPRATTRSAPAARIESRVRAAAPVRAPRAAPPPRSTGRASPRPARSAPTRSSGGRDRLRSRRDSDGRGRR
ncbi:hypothetical protein [Halomonas denitrificans]|nr:hypothetical protein [Halomonas denitrificans]